MAPKPMNPIGSDEGGAGARESVCMVWNGGEVPGTRLSSNALAAIIDGAEATKTLVSFSETRIVQRP